MPLYFTLSDANFSPRTLAMLKSVRKYDHSSRVIFFHFDDLTVDQITSIRSYNIETCSLPSFIGEATYSRIKESRNYVEFMWTLPSVISRELVCSNQDTVITDVIYLDADLYFYSPPIQILQEIPLGKISIVKHNFSNRLAKAFPESGVYNVSWVSFPTTEVGLKCADEWASNCTLLCPSVPTFSNGKLVYGDQLYLEDWPKNYRTSLHVIQNIGAGVAPWNYEKYSISNTFPFTVNCVPIIFYHFSSHQYGFWPSRRMGSIYSASSPIPVELYRHYEQVLGETASELGFSNWRSRHQPLYIRLFNFLCRLFK